MVITTNKLYLPFFPSSPDMEGLSMKVMTCKPGNISVSYILNSSRNIPSIFSCAIDD